MSGWSGVRGQEVTERDELFARPMSKFPSLCGGTQWSGMGVGTPESLGAWASYPPGGNHPPLVWLVWPSGGSTGKTWMCLVGRIGPPRWFLNQQPQDRRLNATPACWQTRQRRAGGRHTGQGGRGVRACLAGNLVAQEIVSRCDRAPHRIASDRWPEKNCRLGAQDIGTCSGMSDVVMQQQRVEEVRGSRLGTVGRGFSCRRKGAEMMGLRDMGAHMLYPIWASEYLCISPPGSSTVGAVG